MKIKNITITDIGGIQSLSLDFDDRMNIISGPNSIGKTTVLECIGHIFSNGNTQILKKRAGTISGRVSGHVLIDGKEYDTALKIDTFEPSKISSLLTLYQYSDKLLVLKSARTWGYQSLTAIHPDKTRTIGNNSQYAQHGINSTEVKAWLVNRFLYSAHPNVLSEEQLANYKLAKSCFSILDPTYSFAHVNPSTNEIMLNSPSGLIYLEYLSSGYKACLSILLGVIKEIEYRFQETKLRAAQFDGILLIDELSLHLHPNWQAQIKDLILNTFPNIQLIATTHSPHVIQRLSPNEIIALSRTENGVVKRELPSSEYGYQGWTLEEVLEDVMGMSSTTTQLLDSMFSRFEESIEQEDYQQASLAFKELDKLLHPNNHLRKLLRLQLASIAEDND